MAIKRIQKAYQRLYKAVIGGGVEQIIQAAHEIFERPVLLTDEHYRLICQVPKKPIGNDIWDRLLEEKELPANVIREYQKIFLNSQTETYQPFYGNWGPAKDSPRIFGELVIHQKIAGHVAVFLQDRPLQEGDLEITQIMIDMLTIELVKQENRYSGQFLSLTACLLDLLDPDTSFREKHHAAERLQQRVPGNYIILVTPVGNNAANTAFASYIVNEFTRPDQNVVSVLHDYSIVTLIGGISQNGDELKKHPLVQEIVNVLNSHEFKTGMSGGFTNLEKTKIYFKQALLTAVIAKAKERKIPAVFSDYAPLQIFVEISRTEEWPAFVHPTLETIREYDSKYDTEYYLTLKSYIMNIFDKKQTMIELSIHRNTLTYRLNRMKEIFHLDIDDKQTAFHLYCSFMIYEGEKIKY